MIKNRGLIGAAWVAEAATRTHIPTTQAKSFVIGTNLLAALVLLPQGCDNRSLTGAQNTEDEWRM